MKKAKMIHRLKKTVGKTRQPVEEKPIIMKGKVTAKILNVRSKSDKTGDIVGKVKNKEIVEIIGIEDAWYEINFNDSSAFVFAKYIKAIVKSGFVNANLLNVRSLPNKDGDKIGQLTKDIEVIVVDKIDDWYRIMYKDGFGYVFGKFIEFKKKNKDGKQFLYTDTDLQKVDLEPSKKLDVTGDRIEKTVRATYNKYGNLLKALSKKLGIETASAIAVLGVESGGKGFDDDKVLIRFENHLFYRYWGKHNPNVFNNHFKFGSDKKWLNHYFRADANGQWEKFHGNQEKEHEVLEFARKLDDRLALLSISMGLPQILGSNSKLIGYDSVQEMYENFNKDIRFHIFGLFDFLSPRMIKYLKNREFVNFAKYYNGAGQARRYGKWIQDYYEAFPEKLV